MTDREKLIALMEEAYYCSIEQLADHLIANGVVVREKGEWVMKETMIRSPYAKNAYCPFCLEETGYAHNFCPNCGADMRGSE